MSYVVAAAGTECSGLLLLLANNLRLFLEKVLFVFGNDQWQNCQKQESLTKNKSGSSVKADCDHALPVYPHLMRLFGNTMTPLINVFHFKSACQKTFF